MGDELTREERFKKFIESPDFMTEMFNHLANGGDLITFCDIRDIRYNDLAYWIAANPNRSQAYTKAIEASNEWIRRRILNELKSLGLVDIRGLYNEDGSLKPPSQWPDSVARAMTSVETEELFDGSGQDRAHVGYTKKVKLESKIKALELLGKELGMFIQKIKHEGTLKLEDIIAGSREDER